MQCKARCWLKGNSVIFCSCFTFSSAETAINILKPTLLKHALICFASQTWRIVLWSRSIPFYSQFENMVISSELLYILLITSVETSQKDYTQVKITYNYYYISTSDLQPSTPIVNQLPDQYNYRSKIIIKMSQYKWLWLSSLHHIDYQIMSAHI